MHKGRTLTFDFCDKIKLLEHFAGCVLAVSGPVSTLFSVFPDRNLLTEHWGVPRSSICAAREKTECGFCLAFAR